MNVTRVAATINMADEGRSVMCLSQIRGSMVMRDGMSIYYSELDRTYIFIHINSSCILVPTSGCLVERAYPHTIPRMFEERQRNEYF